jgi:NAD(P)H-hydrate epimerase
MKSSPLILTEAALAKLVPKRKPSEHKYSFGSVEIWGGAKQYPGALYLSALGAFKSGVGFVYLVSEVDKKIVESLPECVWGPGPVNKNKTVLMGSGWGREISNQEYFLEYLESESFSQNVTVIDGDALGFLGENSWALSRIKNLKNNNRVIVTPHFGEAMKLLAIEDKQEKQRLSNNRIEILKQLSRKLGPETVIVLKGSPNWVFQSERFAESPWGSVAMAQAGHGDLLGGMVAGFCAQGLSRFDACCLALGLQGLCADRLSQNKKIDRGVLAHEVATEIPSEISRLQDFKSHSI